MKWEMKLAEAPSAIRQLPASTTADSTTRTRMLGVQPPAKVWIEVTMDSTAPYRLRALWLMMLSRNSSIRTGPSTPVACFTAAMASVPSGVASTATAPKLKDRMVPRQAPK
ncbi:hypothetical protein D3C72_1578040 [compost metagenome]